MSISNPVVDKIAKTLCFASRVSQEFMYCPFCENGKCQPEMWTSFRPEAEAVHAMLKRDGELKQKLLLPGLGG